MVLVVFSVIVLNCPTALRCYFDILVNSMTNYKCLYCLKLRDLSPLMDTPSVRQQGMVPRALLSHFTDLIFLRISSAGHDGVRHGDDSTQGF